VAASPRVTRPTEPAESAEAHRFEVEGTVQGVGFRPWVHRVATSLDLVGRVFNTPRGVTIEAVGPRVRLDALLRALREEPPRASRVVSIEASAISNEASRFEGFAITPSEGDGARLLTVPADLATCDACSREVDDPTDRHFGYPFTSCTECGPRFSIVEALPYDRARTTLGAFPLCPDCAREYRDLGDRRFHAQAVACPACGPKIFLEDANAARLDVADPLAVVAERLLEGRIVAVQGLGGFHLACDATSGEAVAELRRRKRRDDKPFAVMVESLAAAELVAELDDAARKALLSPARPIVLAPARFSGTDSDIAPEVFGLSTRIGVFLPYTPLHKLLLARLGEPARPLVMTSGNLSGEPIAITHADARRSLGGIADLFLLHDRPIERRVEDSVVASANGTTRVVRRARGFAPDAIRLPAAASEPILAVGGHLKNTACLVLGDRAYVTPHLGDLETFEAEQAFRVDVERFEKLLGVRAEIVAHDLHPFYASTRYARERPARLRVGVQHHVAHVLAAVAELHLEGPVIGVVFDGTGWGTDLTAWGAEILRVDGSSWSRPSTFRALPLAGGEKAIREVWRIALGVLRESFGEDEARAIAARLPLFRDVATPAREGVFRMLASGVQTVAARGMGRWFDAFGALALGLATSSFEGQVAMALEEAAIDEHALAYPVTLPTMLSRDAHAAPANEIDLRPTVRAAVHDLLDGVPGRDVAARFHRTIVDATSAVVACALAETHAKRVVLSGGSLQNRRLERGLTEALGRERVAIAREVPVNDGGIALGQAWAAVLAAREWRQPEGF
jgi:hydrogenase maturation protein HypF